MPALPTLRQTLVFKELANSAQTDTVIPTSLKINGGVVGGLFFGRRKAVRYCSCMEIINKEKVASHS